LGRVILADKPYSELQPDWDGKQRTVWMFPLRLVDESALAAVPTDLVHTAGEVRARLAHEVSARPAESRPRNWQVQLQIDSGDSSTRRR